MIRHGSEIRISFDALRFAGFGVYLFDYDHGTRRVPKAIEWEPVEDGAYLEPMTRIMSEAAQQLMDDLWSAGLRPTAGRQSEGVTSAQALHLDDMRAIAFAKLNVAQPGSK